MGVNFEFQPDQIVCLEHENSYLYAEVIQIVKDRQVCWVRPLMLNKQTEIELSNLYDLRESADLILPIKLFRSALDTEVIPLLFQLESSDHQQFDPKLNRQQLNLFVHEIWQAEQDI